MTSPALKPTQAEEHRNTCVFEKSVDFLNLDGSITHGRIDLYRRAHFVLEAKQGSNGASFSIDSQANRDFILTSQQPRTARQRRGTAVRGTHGWDEAMLAARGQAEQYAKALPPSEGWPPFLITVDVGHSIELFGDFSLTGKAYLPFPTRVPTVFFSTNLPRRRLVIDFAPSGLTHTPLTPRATRPALLVKSPQNLPLSPAPLSFSTHRGG